MLNTVTVYCYCLQLIPALPIDENTSNFAHIFANRLVQLHHFCQPFAQIKGILHIDWEMCVAIGGLVFLFEQIEGIS